jgi:hypothetical protein
MEQTNWRCVWQRVGKVLIIDIAGVRRFDAV